MQICLSGSSSSSHIKSQKSFTECDSKSLYGAQKLLLKQNFKKFLKMKVKTVIRFDFGPLISFDLGEEWVFKLFPIGEVLCGVHGEYRRRFLRSPNANAEY